MSRFERRGPSPTGRPRSRLLVNHSATVALVVAVIMSLPQASAAETAQPVGLNRAPWVQLAARSSSAAGAVGAFGAPMLSARSATTRSDVDVIGIGATRSDARSWNVLIRTLRVVVLPGAARRNAYVVVALVTANSRTLPVVVAQKDFDVEAEAQGNPLLARELRNERIDEVVIHLRHALRSRPPAVASAWFDFVAWGQQQFDQRLTQGRKRLYMLGDQLDTTEGCQLSARDLSAQNRTAVFAACTHGRLPRLDGVHVVQAGAGVGDLSAQTAVELEDLYRDFWAKTGAVLDCWAATLTVDCRSARS